MLGNARGPQAYADCRWAAVRRATEVESLWSLLTVESIAVRAAISLVNEVVQGKIPVLPSTYAVQTARTLELDNDVDVVTALSAVRCDFVYRIVSGRLASWRQQTLVIFSNERMSAVATRDCWDSVSAGSVLGRGAGQKVAIGSVFAAWIVCEEVLEQPWRCLAYGPL